MYTQNTRSTDLVGRNFGKYRLLAELGEGGMGRVFLAEHVKMRRQVAIKVLSPQQAGDVGALERFEREARAVAALRHPNIVQAYDIDQEGNYHYIVMEYVAGSDLSDYVRRTGPVSWFHAADVISQAASALDHAHHAGMVHRDVKPSNLLLDPTGNVKLLDLGLAMFAREQSISPSPSTQDVFGTFDFLAPEQATDSAHVDCRADIYSLGATFYFLLAGVAPFADHAYIHKLIAHQSKKPKSIREHVATVPAILETVVDKMMAKRPQERYQSAAEVEQALKPFARRLERPFEVTPLPIPSPPVRDTTAPSKSPRSAEVGGGSTVSTRRKTPIVVQMSNSDKESPEYLKRDKILRAALIPILHPSVLDDVVSTLLAESPLTEAFSLAKIVDRLFILTKVNVPKRDVFAALMKQTLDNR